MSEDGTEGPSAASGFLVGMESKLVAIAADIKAIKLLPAPEKPVANINHDEISRAVSSVVKDAISLKFHHQDEIVKERTKTTRKKLYGLSLFSFLIGMVVYATSLYWILPDRVQCASIGYRYIEKYAIQIAKDGIEYAYCVIPRKKWLKPLQRA